MMEDRRTFLGLAGAGALAVGIGTGNAAAAGSSDAATGAAAGLKTAFLEVFSGSFDDEKILRFIADNAVIVSHDVPFPLDKDGYTDHLQFHADLWESREFKPDAIEVTLHGKTGIVSCYFNERGKKCRISPACGIYDGHMLSDGRGMAGNWPAHQCSPVPDRECVTGLMTFSERRVPCQTYCA